MIQILDFYADWCGPCKLMSPILEEVEKEMENKIEIKKVDVESDGNMASQYEIVGIPTFVILKDNQEVDRISGAMSKEDFVDWIKPYL